jgi:hypothetical protein
VKALVVGDGPESLLELAEVEEPVPTTTELVVELEASTINRGEVEWLRYAAAGWRPDGTSAAASLWRRRAAARRSGRRWSASSARASGANASRCR